LTYKGGGRSRRSSRELKKVEEKFKWQKFYFPFPKLKSQKSKEKFYKLTNTLNGFAIERKAKPSNKGTKMKIEF